MIILSFHQMYSDLDAFPAIYMQSSRAQKHLMTLNQSLVSSISSKFYKTQGRNTASLAPLMHTIKDIKYEKLQLNNFMTNITQ